MSENGNRTEILKVDLIGEFDRNEWSSFAVRVNQVAEDREDNIAMALTALSNAVTVVAELGGTSVNELCDEILRLADIAVIESR